jgi:hypothetical protein
MYHVAWVTHGDVCLMLQPPDAEAAPDLRQRHELLDELLDIVEDVNFARCVRRWFTQRIQGLKGLCYKLLDELLDIVEDSNHVAVRLPLDHIRDDAANPVLYMNACGLIRSLYSI